jgi:AcrR family transcriptional regulator
MPIIEERIRSRRSKFGQKASPMQERSRQRRQDILRTTALLLDKVGFDDLTTILIAGELGISVGSLYHYFPNKQAILHVLGEQWLQEYSLALDDIAALPLESMSRTGFCEKSLPRLLHVYREQKGVLPLVQAMFSVPELRELDDAHDKLVITQMSNMFRRLGLEGNHAELKRLGRIWLELTHAILLTIEQQGASRASRSLEDLVALCSHLLQRH